jgi:two-component system, NtrC family, C4-dicarboxylate transport response regulator DctD
LKNVAERYALGLAATGRRVAEILRRTEGAGARRSLSERVADYERMLIEASLREHNWSVVAAMENLGVPRRTLNEKMAKYGLLRPIRNSC